MKRGWVRIIAGDWRGRRLQIAKVEGLRPTPDRVRETLFNWLAPVIAGARCLDLFAGSGALGFEALSRGASYVEMVDRDSAVTSLLSSEIEAFSAKNAVVYRANLPSGLRIPVIPFDIIFIDPPYTSDLLITCCRFLSEKGYLAESAFIYLEAAASIKDNDLPTDWQVLKRGRAGNVFYHLAQKSNHHDKNS